jgi:predicted TIM-barrel fold metal-dependent hydrolase
VFHKGLTFPEEVASSDSAPFASCRDVGPAARMYGSMKFIIYHSGYEPGVVEQAFDTNSDRRGVDSLIRSLVSSGVGPGENVYAELGATWRYLMKDPDQASHLIGKLLKYVGEDNIVWGTDSVLFGSPQDQIQAFQSFQISAEYQERYGYPALTEGIKAKIFGTTSARLYGISKDAAQAPNDLVGRARSLYAERADPSFMTYGPRTRAEFLRLSRLSGRH